MPRLIIAEKPSLARAIVAALPRPHQNQQGYIQAANGDVVTWCVGHLLEQVEPDAYDASYKVWRMDDLPILPKSWLLRPRVSAAKQLSVVKKLLKQFDDIVHAGDPDREGQLLVDEVFNYVKLPKQKISRVQRLLINDLNLKAVKKALLNLRSNQEFIPLSVSALARARADWLYGMNMTRAYTLLGREAGFNAVLSVGRVQTPVLGLVVRRDREIENFIPKLFYKLDAVIPFDETSIILARWQPSEACAPWLDEEGRVLSKKLVENVAARIKGQLAKVTHAADKKSKQPPPLPYSLSALQIDAAKAFNMSAAQVLSCCQTLYEKHKVITYPRSDSRYLPSEHFADSVKTAKAIASNAFALKKAVAGANFSLKSKAWNGDKVEAHHAIIPTSKNTSQLNSTEQRIYELIAKQYLMQFYEAAEYSEREIKFIIAGGLFIAKNKVLTKKGWRELIERSADKDNNIHTLPQLKVGAELTCLKGEITESLTEAPRHFTNATILQAMTHVGRFVQDEKLKKILRETDGLGTEATRAGILALLFQRGFLIEEGKQIKATLSGKALIDALPENATYPDMTAHWERKLSDMAEKKHAYQPFMTSLEEELFVLMQQIKQSPLPSSLQTLPQIAPVKKTKRKAKRRHNFTKRSAANKH